MTWLELRELWDERDARYQIRRKEPLSLAQRRVVLEYRQMEAALLPVKDRWLAVEALRSWK